MTTNASNLALVFGGGGARAAYQAGFLRSVARSFPDLHAPVLTGVSAGAINVAHLANHPEALPRAAEHLVELWRSVTIDQIFRTDAFALGSAMLRWALRLVSGGGGLSTPARGLVDSAPLRKFLRRSLGAEDGVLRGVGANLRSGRLRAVSVSTTDYGTGQSVSWVQTSTGAEAWRRPGRRSTPTILTVEHVMASCALPLFFPAVQIGGEWHGDGGVQLTAPLSPALHLGAERIIALSTRYAPTQRESDRPTTSGYPPPATILGVLLDSIFLDMLDHDACIMQRINQLIDHLPPAELAAIGFHPVDLLLIRPSVDLGMIANEFEAELPLPFRFATRGLGTRETRRADLLATLLFQPGYVNRMIEIGERDGEARRDQIAAFLGR